MSRPHPPETATDRRGEGDEQSRDESHAESVIADNVEGMLAYFASRTRPVEDAADLLSETMTVLWRRRADVPHGAEAGRMWAFGVARNVLATHRRTSRRRSALVERLRSELAPSAATPGAGPEPVLTRLAEAVEELAPIDREIVRLVHWDGFTLAEVAVLLDKRPGTVRSRYFRARQQLKRQLDAR